MVEVEIISLMPGGCPENTVTSNHRWVWTRRLEKLHPIARNCHPEQVLP